MAEIAECGLTDGKPTPDPTRLPTVGKSKSRPDDDGRPAGARAPPAAGKSKSSASRSSDLGFAARDAAGGGDADIGKSSNAEGVAGRSPNGAGTDGRSSNAEGLAGRSLNGAGTDGKSSNAEGIAGRSLNGADAEGKSLNAEAAPGADFEPAGAVGIGKSRSLTAAARGGGKPGRGAVAAGRSASS
ncbi:MAG TPA: hypothetical protein VJV79_25795, partial [Polyangiaceae bacterium]|nr:hypothetical protein [Polyangiaceae bacterium]